jgi:hypothetical protein
MLGSHSLILRAVFGISMLEAKDITRLANFAALDSLTGLEHSTAPSAVTIVTLGCECHCLSPAFFFFAAPSVSDLAQFVKREFSVVKPWAPS